MLKVGDIAPDFTAETDGGGSVKLSDLRGKKVVLYFYPKNHTPGCTLEACSFRDAAETFEAKNTVILGASADKVKSHDGFKSKHKLPFYTSQRPRPLHRGGIWGLAREETVRKKVHGHGALDLRHRRSWQDRCRFRQGEGVGPCVRGPGAPLSPQHRGDGAGASRRGSSRWRLPAGAGRGQRTPRSRFGSAAADRAGGLRGASRFPAVAAAIGPVIL